MREILLTHYRNDFDGLDGNEDCGQMSAWFVMSAMGLYAVDPVSATYVLSAPLFKRVSIQLGNGRQLVIEADGGEGSSKKQVHPVGVAEREASRSSLGSA